MKKHETEDCFKVAYLLAMITSIIISCYYLFIIADNLFRGVHISNNEYALSNYLINGREVEQLLANGNFTIIMLQQFIMLQLNS